MSFEAKPDESTTRIRTQSETERLELLINHRRPNDGGGAKFPLLDGGTVGKDVGKVKVQCLCTERDVVVSSSHWQLEGW